MQSRPKTVFFIAGVYVSGTSALPDISKQCNPIVYQKGHKSELFTERISSGNFESAFLIQLQRILFLSFKIHHQKVYVPFVSP